MQLAGFVIHGNSVDSLGACIDSLTAVCDEVVALDSGSTDGSRGLAQRRVRSESHVWRGFGAARQQAVGLLGPSDYVFFLDSDEWLDPPALDAIRTWKRSAPDKPFYRLWRNDWIMTQGRVLYRREHKRRLIRRDHAVWKPQMIVHESLPQGATGTLDAEIEHAFVTSLQTLGKKTREYALLWALMHRGKGSRLPLPLIRLGHLIRDGVIKGAFLRGDHDTWAVAQAVADYHVFKARYARDIGRYTEEARLLEAGEYEALMARIKQVAP